jgi:superfamily II DNA helicase RecQ
LRLSEKGESWLAGKRDDQASPRLFLPTSPISQSSTDYDEALFQSLRAWRLQTSRELGRAPFIIFQDVVLKRIAAVRPATLQELASISGIGPRKLEQFGQDVLAIIIAQKTRPTATKPKNTLA